jgi:cell wall-associated NlpC family hydrolase
MPTAAELLRPSKLNPQQELMRDDVEVDTLVIFIHGKASLHLENFITDASCERTIEGASTVTVTVNDPNNEIANSGMLTNKSDINVDGLYFRLAHVEKQGDALTLTFEDREVALLRRNKSFMKANRATTTRAEFVHSMVRQVKEERIRFFSPQEHVRQPIAKSQDNNQTLNDLSREGGFAPNALITVKGQPATQIQKKNIDTVLSVGRQMGVQDVLLEASIETITVESSAMNLSGGDGSSVGIFQQTNQLPWTKRNRRDVAAASRTFFEQGLAYLQEHFRRTITISGPALAQAIQHSAFPGRYALYKQEAQHTLNAWTGGESGGVGADPSIFIGNGGGAGVYEFSRGTIDELGRITKEDSWTCARRLADEVQWRCFMVSGTVYFIDDPYLFKSRPRMSISPGDLGIDDLAFDYDQGKKNAQVTITCHISRWGAPPGSVVEISDLDPINGRWLVNDITRSLFDTTATITLKKPLPELKEPPAPTGQAGTTDAQIIGPTSGVRDAIVTAARKALAQKNRYTYRQYRPMAKSLFDAFAYDHTDCSAFATLCYKAGGAPDPNGFSYNGSGNTTTLWARGTYIGKNNSDAQPGDLAFYGQDLRRGAAITTHVGVYIGGGMMIDFGSTPIKQVPVNIRSDFLGFRSYLNDNVSGGA